MCYRVSRDQSPLGRTQKFDMRRREFISLLGGVATAPSLAWPLAARAQQAKVYMIGVLDLTTPTPEPLLKALRDGLRDAGYVEGLNLRLEIRTGDARPALQSENAASWSVSRSTSSSRSSRQPRWPVLPRSAMRSRRVIR
jgi:hypothetical protein